MVFTYGGDQIPDQIAIRVAQAGPANATVVLSSDSGNFEGAAGGQTVAVTEFTVAGFPITAGHLGAHIEPAVYAAEAPFLNRYYTGNSDDNMMHTDLLMNGNNITAAKSITATQQVNSPTLADPNSPTFQITMAGNSSINNLTANGTISSGDYLHLSDLRLKENVRNIEDPLQKILLLQGRRFDWRRNGAEDLGFIAQEVQTIFPEAVKMTDSGYLAVKYDVLTAPLLEAVKQQERSIALQRAEIADLQDRLSKLSTR
jgi:hypothetical protein